MVIATSHNGDEFGDLTSIPGFDKGFRNLLVCIHIHINDPATSGLDLLNQVRESVNRLGPKNKVHSGHAFQNFFPFLLSHTAANANDESLFMALHPRKPTQQAEGLLFCLGPHRTGIDNNHIRLGHRCDLFISKSCQPHGNLF
jgi:hypothetical protein